MSSVAKSFLPESLRIPTKLRAFAEKADWLPAGPKRLILHPAGPLTIHFWAPAMKWGLVIAGVADLKRPAENISLPQTTALAATGIIWSRYATQITPVNYNLLSVNVFVAATGLYQLYRAVDHEQNKTKSAAAATGASTPTPIGQAKAVLAAAPPNVTAAAAAAPQKA